MSQPLSELATEMAKQASLGHTQFCVGVHTYPDGFLGATFEHEEWISWPDAFARLAAITAVPPPSPDTAPSDQQDAARWRALVNVAEAQLVGMGNASGYYLTSNAFVLAQNLGGKFTPEAYADALIQRQYLEALARAASPAGEVSNGSQ